MNAYELKLLCKQALEAGLKERGNDYQVVIFPEESDHSIFLRIRKNDGKFDTYRLSISQINKRHR